MNKSSVNRYFIIKTIGLAIIILMTIVPNIGYIYTPWLKITLIHIPVILVSMLCGPKVGIFMGLAFGFSSLLSNTLNPSVLSFIFTPIYKIGDIGGGIYSIIICFLPRIILGFLSGIFVTNSFDKKRVFIVSALLTLIHTILVMVGIYIFYGNEYIQVMKIASNGLIGALLTIVLINGLTEAIVSGILMASIYLPLKQYLNK